MCIVPAGRHRLLLGEMRHNENVFELDGELAGQGFAVVVDYMYVSYLSTYSSN